MQETKNRGVVKVSVRLLEELIFQGGCRIDKIIENTDDLQNETVSMLISGNETLPAVKNGELIPVVDCQITKENVKVEFVKR